ncbi:hypothetical protein B566_EDAN010124, partial [Ephemera danica]
MNKHQSVRYVPYDPRNVKMEILKCAPKQDPQQTFTELKSREILRISYPLNRSGSKQITIGLDPALDFSPVITIGRAGWSGIRMAVETFSVLCSYGNPLLGYFDDTAAKKDPLLLSAQEMLEFRKNWGKNLIVVASNIDNAEHVTLAKTSWEGFVKIIPLLQHMVQKYESYQADAMEIYQALVKAVKPQLTADFLMSNPVDSCDARAAWTRHSVHEMHFVIFSEVFQGGGEVGFFGGGGIVLRMRRWWGKFKVVQYSPLQRQSSSSRGTVHIAAPRTRIILKHVQQAIKRYSENEQQDQSVLALFLAQDPNPKRAVVMVLDMIAAGVDSTSYCVASVLMNLANNTEKQEKLYQELKTLLPDPNDQLTATLLNEMRYLKACVKESFRLQPPSPANVRTTQEEIVLSNFRVPKDVDILIPSEYLSTMETNFSKTKEFLPERWLRENDNNMRAKNPFVYMPFGYGARKCVGMRLALLEIEVLLAKV